MNPYLQLVSKEFPLEKNQEPPHLVLAAFSEDEVYLQPEAAKQWERLVKALKLEDEICLLDGYRTEKQQRYLWEYSLKENGLAYTKQFVALPGCSEHQLGLAIDVGLKGSQDDLICPRFRDSAAADLFTQEMMNYGFILRYPADKQEVTGIGYEPWHFRYVGLPHSQIIASQQWTLEEYHQYLEQTARQFA
ncbi:D,D-carboxypeptidase/D,D-dipeptidase VanXY [Enterococcus casseliflavus]|uniref:D,D-carboxypeptidase/D,D-dipeptidase VanXY n=1 Tax=Enterococcus casseliflavus TaxID=37734 RepID=UPI0028908355|nr:D,D-carboxypeptidase/D,D-dipeptidase VanXY [Enterococcus casseliflavus]MDT2986133.1 D,D-carboxypeptidase/D,D-dipeptidase VanXY [Enterococcus casseliflavus]